MAPTKQLYLENTYQYSTMASILDAGADELGNYVIFDQTIFYPQGGGQPNDSGYFSLNGNDYHIKSAKINPEGCVKHYVEVALNNQFIGETAVMHISQETRKLHAVYHSAGHWLSQTVSENLQLPLTPIKGHHFPGEAYIEFEGDINSIPDDTIKQIETAVLIDKQANLKIKAEFAEPESKSFREALLPKNFKPPVNKQLRLVTIDNYKPVPCGGTHVSSVNEINVKVTDIYKKGGKIRLPYKCSMQSFFPD